MKKYIELPSGKVVDTKDIVIISEVRDVIPPTVIFDNGKMIDKTYVYTITYKEYTTVSMIYYEIDEAFQDKEYLVNQLNLG